MKEETRKGGDGEEGETGIRSLLLFGIRPRRLGKQSKTLISLVAKPSTHTDTPREKAASPNIVSASHLNQVSPGRIPEGVVLGRISPGTLSPSPAVDDFSPRSDRIIIACCICFISDLKEPGRDWEHGKEFLPTADAAHWLAEGQRYRETGSCLAAGCPWRNRKRREGRGTVN